MGYIPKIAYPAALAASPVNTVTTGAVTSTGPFGVGVADFTNIGVGTALVIDSGVNQETVTVTAITVTGVHLLPVNFMAVFAKTHASGVSVASLSATTLNFTLPPVKKPGAYPIADQEGVGVASITLSGLKQVMWYRTDTFFHLIMDAVPWADMADWQTFIDYALQGGSFLYYPDAAGTGYDEYWLDDSGGSVRNQSSNAQLDAWNPKMGGRQHGQFELVLRKVPGGLHA